MADVLDSPASLISPGSDRRAQQLAAARKKVGPSPRPGSRPNTMLDSKAGGAGADVQLKSFRQSRSSAHSAETSHSPAHSSSSSKSRSSPLIPSSPARQPIPLSTSKGGNTTPRRGPVSRPAIDSDKEGFSPKMSSHRREGSRAMSGHRRQRSTLGSSSMAPARTSVVGLFEDGDVFSSRAGPSNTAGLRLEMPRPTSLNLIPPTPMEKSEANALGCDKGDEENVRSRLQAFSFGAKRSSSPSGLPNLRNSSSQPSLEGRRSSFNTFPSSGNFSLPTSPDGRIHSTPSSRPPSLLLTRPTPLGPTSPNGALSRHAFGTFDSASPPPTPPIRKRHSHSRSSSISLPNLKVGRPTSLGISSPSFPSSPCSPTGPEQKARISPTINGSRLKFEPSGRGAEAEMSKDESRRKTLEALNGQRNSVPEPPHHSEIALPSFDDVGDSLAVESKRLSPETGSFSPTFETSEPSLASLTSSSSVSSTTGIGFGWSSAGEDILPNTDRWPGFPPRSSEDGLGFGMDLGMPKRASMTRQLSVLAEVDEAEEDAADISVKQAVLPLCETTVPKNDSLTLADSIQEQPSRPISPVAEVEPTPMRLRQLHLVNRESPYRSASETPEGLRSLTLGRPSSAGKGSMDSADLTSPPVKGYGAIGRGRPRPLSGLANISLTSSASSSPATGVLSTPKSAKITATRRKGVRAGSRGSSISYKKDDSISSSRDWSLGSRSFASPPPMSEMGLASPPPTFTSPRLGWGSGRPINRPCPRPKSIVGLGFAGGANRILSEVREREEDSSEWPADVHEEDDIESTPLGPFGGGTDSVGRRSSEVSSFGDWRDTQLELEMERDALKDDVEMWKTRCRNAEDALDSERKESAILRERVRKIGSRLSSVSAAQPQVDRSSPSPQRDRLVSDMRDQLFHLTSTLEREKREKADILLRLAQAEKALEDSRHSSPQMSAWSFPKPFGAKAEAATRPPLQSFDLASLSDFHGRMSTDSSSFTPSLPTPIVTPATPLPETMSSLADPNARFRSWGFPSKSSVRSMEAANQAGKRDSFFGLSSLDRRASAEEEAMMGFNVFPYVAHDERRRVFSAPLPKTIAAAADRDVQVALPSQIVQTDIPQMSGRPAHGSTSTSASAASSALSYLAGYLPKTSPSKIRAAFLSPEKRALKMQSVSSMPVCEPVVGLDLRQGCKCCVGEVIEL